MGGLSRARLVRSLQCPVALGIHGMQGAHRADSLSRGLCRQSQNVQEDKHVCHCEQRSGSAGQGMSTGSVVSGGHTSPQALPARQPQATISLMAAVPAALGTEQQRDAPLATS